MAAAKRWLWQVAPVSAAALVALPLYRLLFAERSDYAGHMLAGYGGTLLCLGVLLLVARGVPDSVVLATTVVAIAFGALLEATIFLVAVFDPVDLAHQSLGACVAAAGVAGRTGRTAGAFFVLGGLVALIGGFHFAFA